MTISNIGNYPGFIDWLDNLAQRTIEGEKTPLTWANNNLAHLVPMEEPIERLCYIVIEAFSMDDIKHAIWELNFRFPPETTKEEWAALLLHIPIHIFIEIMRFSTSDDYDFPS